MPTTLMDAGPLIAMCDPRDPAHADCTACFRSSQIAYVTTWPVVTEAAYFLRRDRRKVEILFSMLRGPRFEVVPLAPPALDWIDEFLERYQWLDAQVADASLMYLAETRGLTAAFTLDRRDFTRYRKQDGSVLDLRP